MEKLEQRAARAKQGFEDLSLFKKVRETGLQSLERD